MNQLAERLILSHWPFVWVKQQKVRLNLHRVDGRDALPNQAPRPGNSNALVVDAGRPKCPAAGGGELAVWVATCLNVLEATRIQVQRAAPQKSKLIDVRFKHPVEGT